MKKKITKENLLIISIFLFALILRVFNLTSRTYFNADQEWLATRAQEILNGDIALIGPITSVGGFSIGPYFIYMWALISLIIQGNPVSGAILSVICGVISLVFIYLFIKKTIDAKSALIITFLASFSVSLIVWDQNPWAPSLFFISQIILLYGAYISNKDLKGYIYMALGVVLGFSSHFGIVLSLISILIYLFFIKPIKLSSRYLIYMLLILLLGFLPNILFDLTHNFINLRRMLGIFAGDGLDYFVSFNKLILVLAHNTIDLVYPRNIGQIDSIIRKFLFAFVIANGIRNVRIKKFKNISLLALITMIFPALFFYIQQGKFSEYYLMMTIPSGFILLSLFFNDLSSKFNFGLYALIIFSIYINYKNYINIKTPLNLAAKERVIEKIIEKGGRNNYGISLTTKYGDQFGFRYILDNKRVTADLPPKKNETRIFSIIIPEGFDGMYGMEDIDGIGLRWSGI